jgi:hypothetical protein
MAWDFLADYHCNGKTELWAGNGGAFGRKNPTKNFEFSSFITEVKHIELPRAAVQCV